MVFGIEQVTGQQDGGTRITIHGMDFNTSVPERVKLNNTYECPILRGYAHAHTNATRFKALYVIRQGTVFKEHIVSVK